jgi:hypothetical protein
VLDSIEIKDRSETWEAEEIIKKPTSESPPQGLSDEQWLEWCYKNILRRDGVDNDGRKTWLGQLQLGTNRDQLEEYFRGLMADNVRVAEALENPERAAMNPIQRIAEEIKEAESEK